MIFWLILIPVLFAAGGAWFMSRFAYTLGLVDIPNDRSSHSLPTPRGGGIGILLAFTVSALISGSTLFFWLPVVFISLVSFFDDKLGLSPITRLIFQFMAALAALLPVLHPLPINPMIKLLLVLFYLVFIVGTANFYNFMDGINGIAGLTGLVGFLLLFFFAHDNGRDAQSLLLLATSCACLGFLPFNLPSARVFMGDVGSILLGFFFAVAVVSMSRNVIEFLALSGCLFPFYADTLSTLFVRMRSGEKLSQAHRRHLYQLLANQMKIPHWEVSLGFSLLQAVIGFVSLELLAIGWVWLILFLGSAFTLWCFASVRIRIILEP